ncbi:MAG: cytochrome C oxidase subunit IV family protein [Planctomycetaceae bacterium]|nr:cytochrome C oxidase subunit IV family protein [Planctomycetaceae bacterium]
MSHEHHESHGATYFVVFLALCVFTAMSVAADMVHMADKNVLRVIVLAIATAKALCVMLYFMHLKFERAWKYLLLAPTFILASALPFALAPDVGLHYYTPDVPQVKEYARLMAAEQQGHSPDEAGHAPAAAH